MKIMVYLNVLLVDGKKGSGSVILIRIRILEAQKHSDSEH
jgi:hypothetical protein